MKRITLLLILSSWLLIACESDTKTISNPFTDTNSNNNTGPAAKSEDARKFEVNVWTNLKADNRCGQCHSSTGNNQAPLFAETSDVNIAYDAVKSLVDLNNPANSLLVTKVGTGHNCWESVNSVCADSIESMLNQWAGGTTGSEQTRKIILTAPTIKAPGDAKTFPAQATDGSPNSFAETIHPIVKQHCIACHYQEGLSQQQSPFFANPDASSAYQAAKPKINIDLPSNSLLVQRLAGAHNCWSDCAANAAEMQAAIEQFASGIAATTIDPQLITSKALTLADGIVASGGNRYEENVIALWEFKAGSGSTAFDTSGIEPAINLNLSGNTAWLGTYGIDLMGGKAQASTQASKKLHDLLSIAGEYSIEAWIIPANVTQEDANIISYDGGSIKKNFTLSQTLYNYNFYNRSTQSDGNGVPVLASPDDDEVVQTSLQHVVLTYDPIAGRKMYVNNALINTSDPVTEPSSLSNWNDSYAFVLGQSTANNQKWQGKLRFVAIHKSVLTAEQIAQNFKVGVGQKFYLLFSIAEQTGIADSYIRFEVSQYDSYSYLFYQPTYINLNENWQPGGFTIKNMRIGINGKEAVAGQSFANMEVTIDSRYSANEGQLLSSLGAIIALEKGAESDEFFLTFEVLANKTHALTEPVPTPPTPSADAAAVSDIGVRTFDEINQSIAKITNIPVTTPSIQSLYARYKQQLPTIESINAFLPSHQMAIAQLALTSCSERVDIDKALPVGDSQRLFTNFDFSQSSGQAFNTQAKRDNAILPLLNIVFNNGLSSQPNTTEISNLLGAPGNNSQTLSTASNNYNYTSLISTMNTTDTVLRTEQIVKALCASVVGSAAMLIQ